LFGDSLATSCSISLSRPLNLPSFDEEMLALLHVNPGNTGELPKIVPLSYIRLGKVSRPKQAYYLHASPRIHWQPVDVTSESSDRATIFFISIFRGLSFAESKAI
jgi:hypothetical protein